MKRCVFFFVVVAFFGFCVGVSRSAYAQTNAVSSSAPNTIGMWSNSVERLHIDSSGNVGIGTTSPVITADGASNASLHVVTAANSFIGSFESAAAFAGLDVNGTGASSVPFIQLNRGTNRNFTITSETDNNTINFRGGNGAATPIMTILKSSGNVGIGTPVPSGLLNIFGSGGDRNTSLNVNTNRAGIVLQSSGSGGGNFNIWSTLTGEAPGGGALAIFDQAAAAFRMVINSSGNVGIGTTSPTSTLTVNGTIESKSGGVKFPDGTTQTSAAAGAGVPSGLIAAFATASCPAGWTEYTPARGRFLRGIDNGAGVDPSGTRVPGNQQADAMQGHVHSINNLNGNLVNGWNLSGGGGQFFTGPSTYTTANPSSDGTNGTPRTSSETRPSNVAVTFCQKS